MMSFGGMCMNINLSKLNTICRVNYQQSVVNMFMKQHITQNGMSDLYVRSGNTMVNFNTYSSFESEKCNYISDLLLLAINNDSAKVRKHGDTYEVAGVQFTADQIPKIDTSKLSEIKACNNTIDFGQNKYFKYVSSDGTSHVLFAENKSVGVPYSEHMRGAEYDAIAQRYSHFWRYMMSDDPVYVGLTYSDDDIDEFMNQAGIEHGFFTVKMGNQEATQYYTKSENTSAVQSKKRYDSRYEHITSTGYQLMNYEPGSVFKLNGKEYILSEKHTLNIPYGEDLWCLEYPSNYIFGEKIT